MQNAPTIVDDDISTDSVSSTVIDDDDTLYVSAEDKKLQKKNACYIFNISMFDLLMPNMLVVSANQIVDSAVDHSVRAFNLQLLSFLEEFFKKIKINFSSHLSRLNGAFLFKGAYQIKAQQRSSRAT